MATKGLNLAESPPKGIAVRKALRTVAPSSSSCRPTVPISIPSSRSSQSSIRCCERPRLSTQPPPPTHPQSFLANWVRRLSQKTLAMLQS